MNENGSLDKTVEIQYNKLAEDWRQLNSMLWAIPSVAISVMAGIVVLAYQPMLEGGPRFITLLIGSIFLFALTLEVLKKGLFMKVITDRINNLQEKGLKLKDIKGHLDTGAMAFSPHPGDVVEVVHYNNRFLRGIGIITGHGREVLAGMIFLAAIAVMILSILALSEI